MDEFGLISKIREKLADKNEKVIVGIGDDTAVLVPPQKHLLTTTDCLVESVHFEFSFISPEELGAKALAVNLSDIAAMGGTPLYALVSLGIREGVSEELILKMYDGMKALASSFGVAIVGGNITKSPQKFFVDVTLIGEADKYWTRDGAKEGDWVGVTGDLGGSACGLRLLLKNNQAYPELTRRHLKPFPKIKEAKALLAIGGVTSAIDISDGLASELHHVAEASQVGFEVDAAQIPFAPKLEEACGEFGLDPLALALFGGEEYQLLLTIQPEKWDESARAVEKLGTKLTKIGKCQPLTQGVRLLDLQGKRLPLPQKGWNHLI